MSGRQASAQSSMARKSTSLKPRSTIRFSKWGVSSNSHSRHCGHDGLFSALFSPRQTDLSHLFHGTSPCPRAPRTESAHSERRPQQRLWLAPAMPSPGEAYPPPKPHASVQKRRTSAIPQDNRKALAETDTAQPLLSVFFPDISEELQELRRVTELRELRCHLT